MSEQLKPCPHCAGPAILVTPALSRPDVRPYVAWEVDFCTGPKMDAETAIAAWNRRAGDAI